MIKNLKSFFKEEDGIGVVEIVIILAIIVGIALVFRDKITSFVRNIMDSIFSGDGNEFSTDTIQNEVDSTNTTGTSGN